MKKSNIIMLLMINSIIFFAACDVFAADSSNYRKSVMIIPLDSRPANVLYPELICKIAGFKPIFPPAELMDNFQVPADTEKLCDWMISNSNKADAYIISASMLCYGGLIASRTPQKHLYQALKNLECIKELKTRYPQKPVFVYDIIQRLAVTADSEKDFQYYKLVREWAILEDKVKVNPESGDFEKLESLKLKIPSNIFKDYINARKRNNAVNMRSIQLCRAGFIDYLVLGQDDASKYGIHKKEARLLNSFAANIKINDRVKMFPGADEICAIFAARLSSLYSGKKISYYALYPNAETMNWIAIFEDLELSESISRHVEVSGAKLCDKISDADIILAVNGTAENETKRKLDMANLAAKIKSLSENGRRLAVVDAFVSNKADTEFVELLNSNFDITRLFAYSALNTVGNKTGFAIAQASARFDSLNMKPSGRCELSGAIDFKKLKLSCAKAHYELLMLRFLKDYSYKIFVMNSAQKYIKENCGDQFNLKSMHAAVEKFVSDELTPHVYNWFKKFKGITMKIDESDRLEEKFYIKDIRDLKITLPWPRIFEAKICCEFCTESDKNACAKTYEKGL